MNDKHAELDYTTTLGAAVADKSAQWQAEAELNLARHGTAGGKFERQHWANGELMVCPVGGRANQAVPFSRAVAIFRAGWKISR